MMMTGSQRSCFFMAFHVLLFLISLLLLHGAPAASSVETVAAAASSSCSKGTAAGDFVSPANRRIEDEDKDAPGREFMGSLGPTAYLNTANALIRSQVCHARQYASCIKPVNPQERPCDVYNRCKRSSQ
nr:protein RALF-like 27 [Ipomoea batatas]GMD56906.1 protein RALF-like 27 [Ipomoea batatas]